MSNPFAQPSAGGDSFEPNEHNGRLIMILAKSYNPAVPTKFGETPGAEADVIVVDAPAGPVVLNNAMVFGNLARSVRDDIGGVVLGRLGQGVNTKGSPPWILTNYTDQDAATAGPVHAQYLAGAFKQPSSAGGPATGYTPQAAPATPDPWAGMNASPTPPPSQWSTPPAPLQSQWGAPSPQASASPAPPASPAPAVDLRAFLTSKGIDISKVPDEATAVQIAKSYPDFPQ